VHADEPAPKIAEPAPEIAPVPIPPMPSEPAPAPEAAPRKRPAAKVPSSPPEDDDALAREMAATAAAKRALASDPAQALELVAAADREFASGVYKEDREGIAVLALAKLGRTAHARERGQAYLAAHPKGSYADRIRKMIEAEAEKP
jgi:hypothetical protein